VSPNIIDASFQALMDSIVYKLVMAGAHGRVISRYRLEAKKKRTDEDDRLVARVRISCRDSDSSVVRAPLKK
jgi:hypothetical protein